MVGFVSSALSLNIIIFVIVTLHFSFANSVMDMRPIDIDLQVILWRRNTNGLGEFDCSLNVKCEHKRRLSVDRRPIYIC